MAVVRIVADSNVATDSVNVWHWECDDASLQAQTATAITALGTFYNAIKALFVAGTWTIGTRVVTVDKSPNFVVPTTNTSVASTGTGPTVLSACVVASYSAVSVGPRYRGRVYLGPVSASQVATGGASWTGTTASTVSAALATLAATSGPQLVVWSRKFGTAADVVSTSVSTAIGTQRRRLT